MAGAIPLTPRWMAALHNYHDLLNASFKVFKDHVCDQFRIPSTSVSNKALQATVAATQGFEPLHRFPPSMVQAALSGDAGALSELAAAARARQAQRSVGLLARMRASLQTVDGTRLLLSPFASLQTMAAAAREGPVKALADAGVRAADKSGLQGGSRAQLLQQGARLAGEGIRAGHDHGILARKVAGFIATAAAAWTEEGGGGAGRLRKAWLALGDAKAGGLSLLACRLGRRGDKQQVYSRNQCSRTAANLVLAQGPFKYGDLLAAEAGWMAEQYQAEFRDGWRVMLTRYDSAAISCFSVADCTFSLPLEAVEQLGAPEGETVEQLGAPAGERRVEVAVVACVIAEGGVGSGGGAGGGAGAGSAAATSSALTVRLLVYEAAAPDPAGAPLVYQVDLGRCCSLQEQEAASVYGIGETALTMTALRKRLTTVVMTMAALQACHEPLPGTRTDMARALVTRGSITLQALRSVGLPRGKLNEDTKAAIYLAVKLLASTAPVCLEFVSGLSQLLGIQCSATAARRRFLRVTSTSTRALSQLQLRAVEFATAFASIRAADIAPARCVLGKFSFTQDGHRCRIDVCATRYHPPARSCVRTAASSMPTLAQVIRFSKHEELVTWRRGEFAIRFATPPSRSHFASLAAACLWSFHSTALLPRASYFAELWKVASLLLVLRLLPCSRRHVRLLARTSDATWTRLTLACNDDATSLDGLLKWRPRRRRRQRNRGRRWFSSITSLARSLGWYNTQQSAACYQRVVYVCARVCAGVCWDHSPCCSRAHRPQCQGGR